MRECNICGKSLKVHATFCSSCGTMLLPLERRKCAYCGAILEGGAEHCSECGCLAANPEEERKRKTQKSKKRMMWIVLIVVLISSVLTMAFLAWKYSKTSFVRKVEKALVKEDPEALLELLIEKEGMKPTKTELLPFFQLLQNESYKQGIIGDLQGEIQGDFILKKEKRLFLFHKYALDWKVFSFEFTQTNLSGKLSLGNKSWDLTPDENLKIDHLFPGDYQGKIVFDGIETPWKFSCVLSSKNSELEGNSKTWDFRDRFIHIQLPDRFAKAFVIIDGKETGKRMGG